MQLSVGAEVPQNLIQMPGIHLGTAEFGTNGQLFGREAVFRRKALGKVGQQGIHAHHTGSDLLAVG